ncbi:uncharacterized protein LOC114248213 [Bombyx mandarina]|uniref:Uncharacterized protein LOC114248213 n=1 Tax=Bombyx mandarina TaxID=7092 RepID=A0A6J2K4H2_BOMMA|nr:uncharacterized protein LOC114248213 [Bombyx mandarina]
MKQNGTRAVAVLALLLAGADSLAHHYKSQSPDFLRLMAEKHWLGRWDRRPHIEAELGPPALRLDFPNAEEPDIFLDDEMRFNSEKRSAVASALNSGRRRRQPTPALGVLNDMSSYFNFLRDNVETLASLSPQQRSTFVQPPSVVQAPGSGAGSGGGGGGFGKINNLRPFRPSNNIRWTVSTRRPTITTRDCCGQVSAGRQQTRHTTQPTRNQHYGQRSNVYSHDTNTMITRLSPRFDHNTIIDKQTEYNAPQLDLIQALKEFCYV